MYYVGFSSSVIVASLILFQGFNTTDYTNTLSLVAGFVVTFFGIHVLNLSRSPESMAALGYSVPPEEDGFVPGHRSRTSLTGRLSIDGWHGIVEGGPPPPNGRYRNTTVFDGSEHVGLSQLREEDETEDEDDDTGDERTHLRQGKPQSQSPSRM